MKAVIQRVERASVSVNSKIIGSIGKGFLVLLGVGQGDDESDATILCSKISKMRVFCDENDKMNLSLKDVCGELLIISNFTLYANCVHGNRPDFFDSAHPSVAKPLYEGFISMMRETGINVQCGEFGADIKVDLLNDGPVTIILDSKELKNKRRG